MPRTPPTIVAPLPRDPRVMELAKALNISRREAYAAAIEAWTWMSMMERDGVVVDADPDSIDGAVDISGFGQSMVHAGLVGVVNDGLVLPAELRHQQRDHGSGPAAAAAGRDGEQQVDPKLLRRRASNAVSSRKYRRKNKVLGKATTPPNEKKWRSLGHVAGHEVRVFEGQFGCYAMVLGATVNGEPWEKFTTGSKAWTLESVRLVDALPGLQEKARAKSSSGGLNGPPTLVPSYAAFRDDVERLTMLDKIRAAAAAEAQPAAEAVRHADGDDASARHADASASSAGPSAGQGDDDGRKSLEGRGLDASASSADRHADALSSMSCLSKSSSNEEDIGEGRRPAADRQQVQGADDVPAEMKAWEERRKTHRMMAVRFADALGEDVETIMRLWKVNKTYLRGMLVAKGIDPNTGLPMAREASQVPAEACQVTAASVEPSADDKAATGSVGARGADEPVDQADAEAFERLKAEVAQRIRDAAHDVVAVMSTQGAV